MLSVKVVYDNKCLKELDEIMGFDGNPMFEFFNEDEPKELKKAWKYKGEAGAKQVPFIGVYENNKLIKAFYNEDKSYTRFYDWLAKYIKEHAFEGWMSIQKIEGINNEDIKVGAERYGYTPAFTEGIRLSLTNATHWFNTSIVTSIDWENKTFKTLNSTYSFTIDEKEESEHQQESTQDSE